MVQGHTASTWVEFGLELGSASPALGSGRRAPTGLPVAVPGTNMLGHRAAHGHVSQPSELWKRGALPRGSGFLRSWHRALSREEE